LSSFFFTWNFDIPTSRFQRLPFQCTRYGFVAPLSATQPTAQASSLLRMSMSIKTALASDASDGLNSRQDVPARLTASGRWPDLPTL